MRGHIMSRDRKLESISVMPAARGGHLENQAAKFQVKIILPHISSASCPPYRKCLPRNNSCLYVGGKAGLLMRPLWGCSITTFACFLTVLSIMHSFFIQKKKNIKCLYFFLTSLLEYNCFTMVCYFLLYNKVNQPYIYVYTHISSLLRLPPYPTPLGGHKALS